MSDPKEASLSVEVQPSLADFTEANRLVSVTCSIFDAVFRHAVLIAIMYVLMMNATDVSQENFSLSGAVRHLLMGLILAPLLALITVSILWLVMPLLARREFARQPTARGKIAYSFSSQGLHAKGASFESSVAWPVVRDFLQSKKVLVIRISKSGFFLLPKNQIEESSLDAIVALLKDRQVKGPFPK